jgi:response regulator NasT
MTRPLQIVVADDEPEMVDYYEETLASLGHQVVAVAQTGRELVDRCRRQRPDLVVTDIKMPDMDGIEAAEEIARDRPVPLILVSAYHDPAMIQRALDEHVLAYLIKPIKQADLQVALALAMRRFQEFQLLRQQADDLRQAMADRKVIERAKGIIMKRAGLDEATAFQRLQKMASRRRERLIDVARSVEVADDAFQLGDDPT